MVFEYMDHDLTGLADRPGMRFTVPQIKVLLLILSVTLHFQSCSFSCIELLFPFEVLHETAVDGASLLSCKSSTSS